MDWTLRTKRRRNRLAAVLLVFATLSNGACANDVAKRAHHRHIAHQTEEYRHTGGRRAVLEDARDLLDNYGYAVDSESSDGLVTHWLSKSDGTRDRLTVAFRDKGGGLAVSIDREHQEKLPPKWTPYSSKRDFAVEAAVLDGVYPGKSETLSPTAVLGFEYHVDPQILWDATRNELQRREHWMQSSSAPLDVTTASEWVLDDGDPPRRSRYEVMFETHGGAKRLRIHRVVERGAGPDAWKTMRRQRDASLELAFIAARDPARAAEIEAEADEEARRAFQSARDAGLISCG